MTKAIDRLIGLEWLKKRVDAAHKDAREHAVDDLAALTGELGVTEMTSTVFGPEAGSLKYSKTRAKKVVEFNMCDDYEFGEWLDSNQNAAVIFAQRDAGAFAQWWFEETGEVPDGISRVEYVEPAKAGPAKLYRFDASVVEEKLGGNLLASVNDLLLGDGHE